MTNITDTNIREAAVNYKNAHNDTNFADKNGGIDTLKKTLFDLINQQASQGSKANLDIAQIVEKAIGNKYVSIIANGIVRLENITHHNETGLSEQQIVNYSIMAKTFYETNKEYFECLKSSTPIGDRRETMCKYLQGSEVNIPGIKYNETN